jgi:hypothetical protein
MLRYIGSFAYLPTYCKHFCGHAALTETLRDEAQVWNRRLGRPEIPIKPLFLRLTALVC